MTITYQGRRTDTTAATVGAFLQENGGAANAVVEYQGEILDAAALATTPLEDGADLNAYRIVSGG